jgi:Zn-dependent oligopeptidase
MHHLLSRTRHAAHSGFNVAPDFVEVPSQALEGFVWTPEVLDRISGHWRDPSRKLPKELVSKMLAGRRHMAAYGALRQLSFGILDMMMHTLPASGTLDQVTRAAYALAGVPLPQEGTHRLAAFGHMMNGYEAGYYGYMWAKVIAEAVMDEFIKSGPLNKGTGMRLRKEILEAGAGRDEMESVRNFLGGREPGMEPFLRSIGALDIGPNG